MKITLLFVLLPYVIFYFFLFRRKKFVSFPFFIYINAFYYFSIIYYNKEPLTINLSILSFAILLFQYYRYKESKFDFIEFIAFYGFFAIIFFTLDSVFPNIQLIYFHTADNFADTLKLVLSFDYVRENITIKNVLDYWENNPYLSRPNNIPFYFHLTPLYLLIVSIFGLILKYLGNGYLFVLLSLIIMVISIFLSTKKISLGNNKILFFFTITSYPFLFTIQRGNFVAFIIFILLNFLIINYLSFSKLSVFEIIIAGIILNLRPNYIFIYLIFFILGKKKLSFSNLFKILTSNIIIFLISLFLVRVFHKEYSISNFLTSLRYYTNEWVIYGSGDGFDSSLLSLIKQITKYLKNYEIFQSLPSKIFDEYFLNIVVLIFLLILIFYISYRQYAYASLSEIDYFFKLTFISLLISPKIGDYHLLILVTILTIFIISNDNVNIKNIFPYLILLILLPKPHKLYIFNYEIELSLLLNSLSLIYLLSINTNSDSTTFRKNSKKFYNF